MRIEFLWFDGCPNHTDTRRMLREVLEEVGAELTFEDINASDPVVARRVRFAGSPSIRIDGRDIEPGFREPGDYTPACRVYATRSGLAGLPEREWILAAVKEAQDTVNGL